MAKKKDIEKVESAPLQPLENIENLIQVIRGKQVILDRDLARLYVWRNDEPEKLTSQIVISSDEKKTSARSGLPSPRWN